MEYILDFQGFKSGKNGFIVKELALVSTDGQLYELQLFQPPCHFNQLTDDVQKEVIWLEKHHHGFYWGSGFKPYSQMRDIFQNVKISGKVYVKGGEKTAFIAQLLTGFDVQVINLEDLGCPGLSILKQKMSPFQMKPCSFNHNTGNCAYVNAYVLLEWLRFEKYAMSRLESINLAIKESKGSQHMSSDLIKFLPKEFILNYIENVDLIYNDLPETLKRDEDILMNLRCKDHCMFQQPSTSGWDVPDGLNPKRKNCSFCMAKRIAVTKFINKV